MRKVNRTESGCALSASAGSLALERDGATGRYRVLSEGLALDLANASAAEGNPVRLYEPNGTRAQR